MYLCWSLKGGSGTSVVAAALALHLARNEPTWLVDLAGDALSVMGATSPAPDVPGVFDWMRSSVATPESLRAIAIPVADGCAVVPPGQRMATPNWALLADALHDSEVIVDAGCGEPPAELVAVAHCSLLVTRPCYLSMRRAAQARHRPTGVVLVTEPGRFLKPHDIAAAVGAPVVATVRVDPAVAAVVDSGTFATRPPRSLLHQIGSAA